MPQVMARCASLILLIASVRGAPCDCKPQWSWAGDTFANCQYTPSNFNFATCEVEGPVCDTASNYIDPATGTNKTHKMCVVGTDPIKMDNTTDCVCDTTWSWSTDAACQDVSGCPATACVAPPFFLAKSWCKVKNAPCKTATENTAGPSYSICTPEEIVGACDCLDMWEHNGANYTGCSTTPENPGVPWCKIHASCKTGMKAYDNTWTEYYWKACTDGLGTETCKCKAGSCMNKNPPYCEIENAPCKEAPEPTPGMIAYGKCKHNSCECLDSWRFNGTDQAGCSGEGSIVTLGSRWCEVGATCATATNTTDPSDDRVLKTTTCEEVGACDCMDEWEYFGKKYQGCQTTMDNPSKPWCMVKSFSCVNSIHAVAYRYKFCDIGLDLAKPCACKADSVCNATTNPLKPWCIPEKTPCDTAPKPMPAGNDAYISCTPDTPVPETPEPGTTPAPGETPTPGETPAPGETATPGETPAPMATGVTAAPTMTPETPAPGTGTMTFTPTAGCQFDLATLGLLNVKYEVGKLDGSVPALRLIATIPLSQWAWVAFGFRVPSAGSGKGMAGLVPFSLDMATMEVTSYSKATGNALPLVTTTPLYTLTEQARSAATIEVKFVRKLFDDVQPLQLGQNIDFLYAVGQMSSSGAMQAHSDPPAATVVKILSEGKTCDITPETAAPVPETPTPPTPPQTPAPFDGSFPSEEYRLLADNAYMPCQPSGGWAEATWMGAAPNALTNPVKAYYQSYRDGVTNQAYVGVLLWVPRAPGREPADFIGWNAQWVAIGLGKRANTMVGLEMAAQYSASVADRVRTSELGLENAAPTWDAETSWVSANRAIRNSGRGMFALFYRPIVTSNVGPYDLSLDANANLRLSFATGKGWAPMEKHFMAGTFEGTITMRTGMCGGLAAATEAPPSEDDGLSPLAIILIVVGVLVVLAALGVAYYMTFLKGKAATVGFNEFMATAPHQDAELEAAQKELLEYEQTRAEESALEQQPQPGAPPADFNNGGGVAL
eukprot:Rhum_TRINITY_DN15226_c1_g1::Rhum_TRINITY_DN15226_c1_g1_i1::g.145548::m.145548